MGATSSGPGPAPVRPPQVRAAAAAALPGVPSRPGVPPAAPLTLSPVPQGRAVGSWVRALLGRAGPVPVPVSGLALAPRAPTEEPPLPGWPLPQLVSLFLPEFPVRPSARQQQLKVPSRGSPTFLPGSRCILTGGPRPSSRDARASLPGSPQRPNGSPRTRYRGACTSYRGPPAPPASSRAVRAPPIATPGSPTVLPAPPRTPYRLLARC